MQPAIGPWSNVVRHGPRIDAQSSAAVPFESICHSVDIGQSGTSGWTLHSTVRRINHDFQRSRRWAMLAPRRLFAKFLTGCALSLLAITSGVPVAASEDTEVRCLALTIYFEARGESELGQLAVGHVVMNRTRDADFPRTVCGVVQQGGEARNRCQFSWWCDGLSDRPRDKSALLASLELAIQIYHGCSNDLTGGRSLVSHRRSPTGVVNEVRASTENRRSCVLSGGTWEATIDQSVRDGERAECRV